MCYHNFTQSPRIQVEIKGGRVIKTFRFIFFGAILFLLPAYSYSSPPGDLYINFMEGDVQIKSPDTDDWIPVSINMPLMEGDAVWVPHGGTVGIHLRGGTYIRLNEQSSLEILRIEKDSFQLYLSTGHAYVNFSGRRGNLIQMDTPVTSVRAYDRSRFRVDVSDNGSTDVSVFKGTVNAESKSGKTIVDAGKILYIGSDIYAELATLGPPDDWEKWNNETDRKFEMRYSSRYLPGELNSYSYDFDENGKWVYVRDYGYCWTPAVISVGWSPYRFGRWTWIGGDYVWVSYDPWGWVPYHYGRWIFAASFGWCWVPPVTGAVYWGPGFVGWVYTPTYVAWVPLAPGEIYYGYGYYGPQSVNIVNVNINTIQVTKVYQNAYITNAVTTVDPKTFVSGKYETVRTKENPFLAQRINVGRPQISPTRTSFMPVVKEIPPAKQPPRAVRQIQVKELKEKRPAAKDPSQSVLRPGTTLKKMAVTITKGSRRPGTAIQPKRLQPEISSREVKKPEGVTKKREIQKPGIERMPEVQKPRVEKAPEVKKPKVEGLPEGKRPKIEGSPDAKTQGVKKPKVEGAPKEAGKQSVQQKKGKETEKEPSVEPGAGRRE